MTTDIMGDVLANGPVLLWALGAGVVVVAILLAALLAPAKTTILVDTPTSTARADMRLLWGFGPKLTARALPHAKPGDPVTHFNDVVRVGNAFLTPGIADVAAHTIQRLMANGARVAHTSLAINTGDYAKDLVVQTGVQAALTLTPAAVRDSVTFSKCAAPGAELTAKFELFASPMQLASIWNGLRKSRPAREFVKRLRRKPKPVKKPVREVRAT
ncbi:MAG: hypothetical protein H7124_17560 [Phycisphaerales bacterium]|nr:hypothetical protein [Hyphomonadaceae bacterium]